MIIAIDFDGTIAEHKWFEKSNPTIGKEMPGAIKAIQYLKQCGHQIILWTGRSGYVLCNAVKWCTNRGLIFDGINENVIDTTKWGCHPKIYADMYIDDKSPYFLVNGIDWNDILTLVKQYESIRKNKKDS